MLMAVGCLAATFLSIAYSVFHGLALFR
jgi:hypothetical protein